MPNLKALKSYEAYKNRIEELHHVDDVPDDILPKDYKDKKNIVQGVVGEGWAQKLLKHCNNSIVHIILDDSGSTTLELDQETIDSYRNSVPPYKTPNDTEIKTRIDEGVTACFHLTILLEKTNAILEFEFLNKDTVYVAKASEPQSYIRIRDILKDFLRNEASSLSKGTPLCRKLKALNESLKKRPVSSEKEGYNHITVPIIDGEPNDYGNSANEMKKAFNEMKRLLEEKRKMSKKYFTDIVLISDSPTDVQNVVKLDSDVDGLDVSDDYFSSYKRIEEVYNMLELPFYNHMFTIQDYFIKMIIGAVDLDIDSMDELEKMKQKIRK